MSFHEKPMGFSWVLMRGLWEAHETSWEAHELSWSDMWWGGAFHMAQTGQIFKMFSWFFSLSRFVVEHFLGLIFEIFHIFELISNLQQASFSSWLFSGWQILKHVFVTFFGVDDWYKFWARNLLVFFSLNIWKIWGWLWHNPGGCSWGRSQLGP